MPERLRPIILIGLRASGKTTVGRALAERLDLRFVDLDPLTAAQLGEDSAGAALAEHGEQAFRRAEAAALADAINADDCVLSLGGGTPTAPGAGALLEAARERALIVYLRAQPETLRARLTPAEASSRPTLTGMGTVAEIETLFAQRDPLYRRLATLVIDVDGLDEGAIVERIAGVYAG